MDHCTWFPEGWWAKCCQAHDQDYLAQVLKWLADERLWQCVATSASDNPLLAVASGLVASVMFGGVTLFGKRWYDRARPKK